MSWEDDGLCRGTAQPRKSNGDVVDWFFDTYEKDAQTRVQVKELCNSCPVQVACHYTGTTEGYSGVWGGVYLENGKPADDKFE